MKYRRKTIERWKFEVLAWVLITILSALLLGALSKAMAQEPPLSPLGSTTYYVDKPVRFEETDQAPRTIAEYVESSG